MLLDLDIPVDIQARTGSHSVFSISLHFVCVTHYRRKVLNTEMLNRLRQMIEQLSNKMDC